jgi:FAD/FMN-containing dehydrogenase
MTHPDPRAYETAGFSGALVDPDDARYDDLRRPFNAMVDAHPALIARCRDTGDVSLAVTLAASNDLELSVFGGGHSVAGHCVRDGALMIDLRPMTAITIDPEARTCRAEPGLTWAEFDAATQTHGLAVTGGRMSSTGIAGLTLGGGSGWLERRCGYTSDNLISVEIVTADGRILTASADENPQLFWGVRGGGGNFGVVTSFEYQLHVIGPTLLAGALLYPADMAAEVLRNFREAMKSAPDEVGAGVALITAPPHDPIPEPVRGQPVVMVVACFAGPPGDAATAALRPLREFGRPALDMVEPMPYVALQQLIDPGSPPGLRNHMTADFLGALPDEAIDVLCAHHLTKPSALSDIVVLPGGGALARPPEDHTAFGNRQAPFNYLIHAKWADAAGDAENIAWARDLHTAMKPYAAGAAYLNYIGDEGRHRVVDAFGSRGYARLVALKDRYDPGNRFSSNQNVRPSGAVPAEGSLAPAQA